ncbi:MAG: FHA domain-containing protein [Phycisphaerae bacterium]|nr:FHA domain-containing protein [Phycisphaerae bacterium]
MARVLHVVVKRKNKTVSEQTFDSTPIYIGRKPGLQIILPDIAVSREHAMIEAKEGKWTLEDLKSANKTYLNGQAIRKAAIRNGDTISITEFSIELAFEDVEDNIPVSPSDDTVSLAAAEEESEEEIAEAEETSVPSVPSIASIPSTPSTPIAPAGRERPSRPIRATAAAEAASLSTPRDEVIVRKPDGAHAPAMRLAARRLTDFAQAIEVLGEAKDLDDMVQTLIKTSIQQFTAFRVWCGLRSQKTGPITFQAGKRRDGKDVQLDEIRLGSKIMETFERGQSLVLPQVSAKLEQSERIRSAMIASIKTAKGCFGVIYVDNSMVHSHFSLSDLDYLMVLAMHTAAVLKTHL